MATSAATCCICDEVYNLEERKPLLLPCSHTFCLSCLQQMESIKNTMCPVCRSSWEDQSLDNLPFTRQLIELPQKPQKKKKPAHQNICAVHKADQFLWCSDCSVPICNRCLVGGHKSCNWIPIEEKNTELIHSFQESATSTRKKLIEKFTHIAMENNLLLIDIQENIKKLQRAEKIVRSFLEKNLTMQENKINKVEKYEKISQNSSVTELTEAIKNILALLEDPITVPIVPKYVVPDCEEPADDTDMEVELDGDVAAHSITNTSTFLGKVRPVEHDAGIPWQGKSRGA